MDTASLALGEAAAVAAGLASAGVERSKRMNRLVRWLDGLVERLCNWLNDRVSGSAGRRSWVTAWPAYKAGPRCRWTAGSTPESSKCMRTDTKWETPRKPRPALTPAKAPAASGPTATWGGSCAVRCGGKNLLGLRVRNRFQPDRRRALPVGFRCRDGVVRVLQRPCTGRGSSSPSWTAVGFTSSRARGATIAATGRKPRTGACLAPPEPSGMTDATTHFMGLIRRRSTTARWSINMNADASCN